MEDIKQIDVTFNRKDFNDAYLPYLDAPERFLVFYGGRGSGKSVFIAQRYLYNCLSAPYFRLLFSRKVARTIRTSQFQRSKHLIRRGAPASRFAGKQAAMEIICINGSRTCAAGRGDMEQIKSIHEIADVWCEEATERSQHDIIQLHV